MAASHRSTTGASQAGGPRQRSLPGFAAFLRPHSQLQSFTDDSAAPETFKQERERPSYVPSASSVFTHHDDHRQHQSQLHHQHQHHPHPHHHQYGGLNSLRPSVVAPAPPLSYDRTNYSPVATFKPRKAHAYDTPSPAARRAQGASISSSSSSSPANTSSSAAGSFHPLHLQLQQDHQHRQSVRTSRYLRETDRRAILQRILNGEKQADLAKEYQVSRAAISNLKQRRRLKEKQQGSTSPLSTETPDVTTATSTRAGGSDDDEEERGEEHDEEKQRRARRRRSSDESSSHSEPLALAHDDDTAAIRAVAALRLARREPMHGSYRVASPTTSMSSPSPSIMPQPLAPSWTRAARPVSSSSVVCGASVPLLLAQLQRAGGSDSAFRVSGQRLARLLLEETLGRLPTRSHDSEEVVLARPVCAIAVNNGHGSQLLLDEFRAIEPLCGVGAVRTHPPPSLVHAPEQLSDANVLLLDLACSETGDELCAALETLRTSGVDPRNVFVATLVSYESGIAGVWDAFPQLGDLLTTKLLGPGPLPINSSDTQAHDLVWQLRTRLMQAP